MGCGSSTPTFDLDPKETIKKVLFGKFAPEMLDSVLTNDNVDTPLEDDELGMEVTPLLMATNIGNIPALKAILALSPNLSATDDNGNTALHIAVSKGRTEAVEELIKAGSDVNMGNSEGIPPLRTAILQNDTTDILEKLLQAGAKTDFTTPALPLVTAVNEGKLEAVEVLLQNGADHKGVMVSLASGEEVDIYTWATKEGNSRIVGLLALGTEDAEEPKQPEEPKEEPAPVPDAEPTPADIPTVADGAPNTVIGDNALLKEEGAKREGGDGEEEPPGGGENAKTDDRPAGDGDVQTAEEPKPAPSPPPADTAVDAATDNATTNDDTAAD